MQALALLCGLALAADLDLGENPVTKVARLLQDMQAELEKEKKADAELYDQLDCWCETNKKSKDAAVDAAQRRITSLQAQIEENSAKAASLKTSIAKLQEEIARCNESLSKATSLRNKENAEFTEEDKELMTSIASVSAAIETLSKHHGSFLQVTKSVGRSATETGLSTVEKGVKASLAHHAGLKPSQRHVLENFLQAPSDFNSYNSRSGAIYGILQQMQETFEQSQSSAQQEEQRAVREYEALKAAKTREVEAAKGAVMDKTRLLAETDEAKVHAKHDLQATRDALSADQQFLLDLQTRCANGDEEYAKRTQMRDTELAAVGDAIAILRDDSARDIFSATLSFVDVGGGKKVKASRLLRKVGSKTGNQALVSLAAKVQLDSFTKVIGAIDEMVVALKQEMKDEVEQQRFCSSELQANAKEQAAKNQKITDLSLSIEDMAATMETLRQDIAQLKKEVSETNTAIKRASEDREAENREFQQTVADQRATQQILAKVLARLNKVYAQLVQGKTAAKQEPAPANFKEYKQASGAGSVLSLIQKIMHDANSLEKDAVNAEQDAQAAYEGFVKDSSRSVGTANRAIAAKSEELAELETASVAAGGDKKAAAADLERLGKFEGELHMSCDYVLQNFEARQTARGQEIEALHDAKAILSGADFD